MTKKTNDATAEGWRNRIVGEGEVPAGELVPHPQNWRKHPAQQGGVLTQSLDGVGWVQRVIVNKRSGRMLDGHLRAELARKQGEATPVPVVYVDLSEDEERTVLATLDPIAGMAIADEATLAGLVRSIEDADLRSVAGQIAQTLNVDVDGKGEAGKDTEPQVDRAEELRQKWGVEPGQLWQLGEHRLICGDCTDAAVVARVMKGEKAQVLFTSPPYWVGFEYENEDKWTEVLDFIRRFVALYVDRVNQDGRIIINTGTVQAAALTGEKAHMKLLIDTWSEFLRAHGWFMRYVRFWVKDGGLLHVSPQSDCIDQHTEFLGYFYFPKAKFRGQERTGEPWAGKGYWSDIQGAARQTGHIAAFPLAIPERNLLLFTRSDEAVLEPFSGSGTTLIACENLGRRCRAVEIAPGYVAVALERWLVHTGKTPVLLNE